MMNLSQSTKFLAGVCLAALLVACGGGGGDTASSTAQTIKPADLKPAEWASPAVFVTPGQTSASFALTQCDYFNYREDTSATVYQGKLVISSEGDVSVVGALSNEATATVSTLLTLKFAQASYVSWTAQGTVEAPEYSLLMKKLGRIPREPRSDINLDSGLGVDGSNSNEFYAFDGDRQIDIYDCRLNEAFAPKTLVNPERVAVNLGKGVAEIDAFFLGQTEALPNGLSEEFVFWSSVARVGEGIPQLNYRFNTSTGVLLRSVGTDSMPMTTESFALPTNADEITGLYSESVCRNSQFYGFNEAKSIIATPNLGRQSDILLVTRYADKWMPVVDSPRFINLFGSNTKDCIRPSNSFSSEDS
jgi:hypothetical protein